MKPHMNVPAHKIRDNLSAIQARINAAATRAGRNPESVTLVAVTKSVGIAEMRALLDLGVEHFAENRIDSAREKMTVLGDSAKWHMIGNLQRRKVKEAVALFDTIDAVDRFSLAETIQKHCQELGKTIEVLVEVNVSGEESKHGFAPKELDMVIGGLQKLERLNDRGLMTMAPYDAAESELRELFGTLRRLGEKHALPELSMGMSHDFEIAIEEGATQVRIGSALFV